MPFPLRQRLLGNKGTVSDDTVQSALVLSALMRSNGSTDVFAKLLAKDLKIWFLAVPPGIGLATIKSCLRLLLGVSPTRSGVNSAGNGAAMRAAIIGAALSSSDEERIKFVEASSRITHSHPDAIVGAQLVALAAALQTRDELQSFKDHASAIAPNWNLDLVWKESGPTGYVLLSVNAAVMICTKPEITLEEGVRQAVALGGDTDTVGAIVGGILGSQHTASKIDENLLKYVGWPQPAEIQSISLGSRFGVSYFRLLGQHVFALPAILAFGVRRLLPPY